MEMITDLLIIGAGGTSREIAAAVADINRKASRWNLLGFLDDDASKHGTAVDGLPVLGTLDSVSRYTARLIIGIAHWRYPAVRRDVSARLALPRERYATIIHPSASISLHAKVGAGTAILQNVVITSGTVVGDHVLILQNVTMAHDQIVEDFVTIAPAATMAGSVHLKEGSYIGAGSTIMNDVVVNECAVVGLGSVLIRNVPAGRTVRGNPAREMPSRRR